MRASRRTVARLPQIASGLETVPAPEHKRPEHKDTRDQQRTKKVGTAGIVVYSVDADGQENRCNDRARYAPEPHSG
jgi:hypothetical protein